MKLVFATSNNGKFSWLERELAAQGLQHITPEQRPLDLTEIQSVDINAISLFKARQAYDIVKQPVLVHDGGFYMNGLNGFPGAYTRDMVDTISIETIAKIISVLDDKRCQFRNVATLYLGPDQYQQFSDTTGEIFTLTDQLYPESHPKQWSPLWRVLVPSLFGYTKPLAAFDEKELDDYMVRRRAMDDASSIRDTVSYLKQLQQQAA